MSLPVIIRAALKIAIFATTLSALLYSSNVILPFSLPKTLFFRSVVEVALIIFFAYLALASSDSSKVVFERAKKIFKNPIVILSLLLLLSYAVSSIFADNAYRAFWGTLERGEGVFGMMHFYAFFFLLILVFEEKDWLTYFKLSIAAGMLLLLYAFLEYFNLHFLFWEPWAKERPESLVGNPAFFATHLIFLAVFAAILYIKQISLGFFWRWLSLIFIPLSLVALFITKTRGAILGVGAGVFLVMLILAFGKHERIKLPLFRGARLSLKNAALLGLIAVIAALGVFWTTRTGDFWQKFPGLDRLALSGAGDVHGNSGEFRFITWKLSWDAFKERPIFGWGPENFINAWEKYYDPRYALIGDAWLDRAHNKIFDILVMQGLVGFALYLGLFAVLIYGIFRKSYRENLALSLALIGGIGAYFVQNLFLFDQILSDIALFTLLAFVIARIEGNANLKTPTLRASEEGFGMIAVASLFGVVCLASLYFWNIIPYAQAKVFKISPQGSSIERTHELVKKAVSPYNFAQATIRGPGIDEIYMENYFYNPKVMAAPELSNLTNLLIDSVHEIVLKEPYDIRFHIRVAQMKAEVARSYPDGDSRIAETNREIEKVIRDAIARAPRRPDLYYHLSFSLVGQDKFKEAIEASEYAISLAPEVPRSHLNKAVIYAIADDNEKSKESLRKLESLESPYRNFLSSDYNSLILLYSTFAEKDNVTDLILKSSTGEVSFSFDRNYYFEALDGLRRTKDKENFLLVAKYLAKFSDLKEDMETLIDLAEKDSWDILQNL